MMRTEFEGSSLERYRPRLFGIAFRMLGEVQEAEDLVQETLLRWGTTEHAGVREPEAWLVSVVTRLAIDHLRKAQTRRALYQGPWLPEPVAEDRLSPEYRSELASDLSMAFLALLERLAPEERAAFLLRDVFGCDYPEIARALEKSPAAARQTVHRARERVRTDRPRFPAPHGAKRRLLGSFLRALQDGDKDALLEIFDKDVIWTSDGGGIVKAAGRPLLGAERVVHVQLKIAQKYSLTYRPAWLNGEPALLQYQSGKLFAALFCETDGARILAMYSVLNPEKLGRAAS
jgi:RNA polymerase sigma-70 factor (ECF subfamily)